MPRHERVAAELLDLEAQTLEIRACDDSAVTRWRQLDQHRLEQPLTLQSSAGQPLGDALERTRSCATC
jgi:hypothetical protein